MIKTRVVSFVGLLSSLSLASCGSSPAPPAPNHSTTQNTWQMVVTVKTTGGLRNLGITGVTLDRQGNLYLAEFDDDVIYKYSASGNLLARWGEHGSGLGQLEGPDKIAFDAQSNLYVTEVGSQTALGNSRVQEFSPTGMPLAQWGTFGSAPGQFNTPVGIAVDPQGAVYVADVGNHRVQKMSPSGQALKEWHTVGNGTGESTEIGYDLALDASGDVVVSDAHPFSPGSDQIQRFSPAGELLASWGGSGTGRGQFSNPTGVAIDSSGDVFIVDSGNNRIQELSPSGTFLAQWKGPNLQFTSKVALDGHGHMYVSSGATVFRLSL